MVEKDEYQEVQDYINSTIDIKCPVCDTSMIIEDYKGKGVLYCYCDHCDAHRYMQDEDEIEE